MSINYDQKLDGHLAKVENAPGFFIKLLHCEKVNSIEGSITRLLNMDTMEPKQQKLVPNDPSRFHTVVRCRPLEL